MTLWGGRFEEDSDPSAWRLNASIAYDQRMALQDVRGSVAWADALHEAGVLAASEHKDIIEGLGEVLREIEARTFKFDEKDEDIHSAVERRLGEISGPVAGRLHTGRSRNDQVATDLRMWFLDHIPHLDSALGGLQAVLVGRAEEDKETLLPGYTHMQPAQPILLSHWWLSHFWPLQRDRRRLRDLKARTAWMPLGSGALAGTPFPIDRRALANALGFSGPSPNSIDAVSDRDFVAEFLFCAALIGSHLSRLSEAVILFSGAEHGFFELSDAFSTGSSLMPQKKNPDVFELARGRSGTLLGYLTGLMATLKGLPSAYDKDLQEDKLPAFNAFDTLMALLPVLAGAVASLRVRPARARAAIDAGMMATDLADYLVEKGVPFREAHKAVGAIVRKAASQQVSLDSLPLVVFQSIHPAFESDALALFDPQQSVARRESYGGTGPQAVADQLALARQTMNDNSI